MNVKLSNEYIKVYKKNLVIIKIVSLLILIIIDIKTKKAVERYFYILYRNNPKLQYYYIDVRPYQENLNVGEDGKLEIYTNNYMNKTTIISTKHSGNINKSEIVILVIPGGSYKKIGEVEAQPIAKKFFSMGYSSALLKYSVAPHCYPTFYNQGLKAIQILSTKFKKIVIIGFSAGGHLAGLLGTSGKDKLYNTVAMILCYPVISFDNNVHILSRVNFFGNGTEKTEENYKKYSIENRVNKDTLPTFIWTIKNDNIVPYENTLDMIASLKKHGVKHDYRIYKNGVHGMALADEFDIRHGNVNFKNDEVARWLRLAVNFIDDIIKND